MQSRIQELEAREKAHAEWSAQFRKPNGWTVIPAGSLPPAHAEFDNAQRGELELLRFHADPPTRCFLYVDETRKVATTFVGGGLGTATLGRPYRDNFGGTRVPVWVQAVNGRRYAGTYFKSAGDYARVRALKG